jgi:glycosyltransferase involved in cell wall biosynthesis
LRVIVSNSMLTWGGGENWSLTAAAGLRDRGHTLTVVCRPESQLRQRAEAGGLEVVPIQLRGDFNPLAVVKLCRLFTKIRPDVIVCNMDREVRSLGAAARLCGRIPFIRRRGSDYAFKNSLRYKLSYRYLVDMVLVNSNSTAGTILSRNTWMPSEKVKMIYNGIETSRYFPDCAGGFKIRESLGIPPDAFVAGMLGSFLPRKEHKTLLKAAESIPAMHLLLVGPAPDAEYYRELCRIARNLGDRAHFIGAVNNTNDYYNAMNVFVMPSSNEGFGYAAAEAMCAGVPVVVSSATSLPEVAGEAGTVFPVGDCSALADALRELMSGSVNIEQMASDGRRRVLDMFSLERMLTELELFLEEVARK